MTYTKFKGGTGTQGISEAMGRLKKRVARPLHFFARGAVPSGLGKEKVDLPAQSRYDVVRERR